MKKRIYLQKRANEKITVEEGFDEFLVKCKVRNLTKETISDYTNCKKYFCDFYYTISDLCCDITEDIYNQYVIFLFDKKLSDVTVGTYTRNLKVILEFFMEKNYTGYFEVTLPKISEYIKDVYTDEEIDLLLKKPDIKKCNFSEYRNWVMSNFFLGTATRLSTIINIKIKDLDFERMNYILKKTKSRRIFRVPLSEALVKILKEYLVYRDGGPEDYLFCTEYGTQLTTSGVQSAIKRYNLKRGVTKTSVHLYRHRFTQDYLAAKGDLYVLKEILGHSTMTMVLLYAKQAGYNLKDFGFDIYDPLTASLNRQNLRGTKIKMQKRYC